MKTHPPFKDQASNTLFPASPTPCSPLETRARGALVALLTAGTRRRTQAGFAQGTVLFMVLIIVGCSLLILSGTMSRTMTVSNLNERNHQMAVNLSAAEASIEKTIARMSYDFQNYGLGQVTANLATYRTQVPTAAENPYWGQFEFSDGQGNVASNYVAIITNFSGALPSQYPGRTCINSPIFRILSNVRAPGSHTPDLTAACQVDVLAALVPITQWAIFYNGLLEFSSCATMTVNGPVHANADVYTGSGSLLTINGTVTTTGSVSSPRNNGETSWSQKGKLNGKPPKSEDVPTITLSIGTNMSAVHDIIDMPAPGATPSTPGEKARLYNQAQVQILVSNASVTLKVQASPSAGEVPGSDPSPTVQVFTNLATLSAANNLPFLTISNTFTDQREGKVVNVVDVNVGKYRDWIATNSWVQGKVKTPTILYVANNRDFTSTKLPGVRLSNGQDLPDNGGLGFTVATPNPLYVKGHYNQPVNAYLNTSNTTTTVPAALMSDALTILSGNWKDSDSTDPASSRDAVNTTVNAAILTGVMPSTGTKNTQFSGGVHNLPRLLEDWLKTSSGGQQRLTLNTSILRLFNSKMATNQFRNPINFGLANNPYYDPPVRQFSYDLNFLDYNKTPPGMPTALVLIKKDWAMPPPNKVNYYASP